MAANSKMESTLNRLVGRMFAIALMACSAAACPGCSDGPLFQLKKISPWHQREWRKDRELGPTFTQRLEQLELIDAQLASMSPQDREKWAVQLEKIVTSDTSAEMRARSAAVLAKIDSEAAIRGLNAASTDEVEKVRLAVCRAWGLRNDEHARDMLLSLAKTDDSDDVRQAALASLGSFDSPDVRAMLVECLDNKNPAIQQQAVIALRSITGRDYGGDFDAWKRYAGGEDVAEQQPASFTARVMQSLPWTK
ncbi:MAG: HEAT repeat domain-containing protein [Aureliella sp.]